MTVKKMYGMQAPLLKDSSDQKMEVILGIQLMDLIKMLTGKNGLQKALAGERRATHDTGVG